jgi:V-type H+-transporting ATPase subunit E
MNDADVGKQIQQMVRFILQEAEEKASEISVAAEEVMNQRSDLRTSSRYQILFRFIAVLLQEFKDIRGLYVPRACMQEFNIEKLQLVESEKKRVRQDYDRKEKQVDIRRKM